MDYKLTGKFQHAKHFKNGTRRSVYLYFLNNVKIFEQKMPFDEERDYGTGKWCYKDEYLLGGRIYQTRYDLENVDGEYTETKTRNVKYPVSKKKLQELGVPMDLKIELS